MEIEIKNGEEGGVGKVEDAWNGRKEGSRRVKDMWNRGYNAIQTCNCAKLHAVPWQPQQWPSAETALLVDATSPPAL